MREQSQVLAKMHVQSDLLNKLAESTLLETDASLINALELHNGSGTSLPLLSG